MHKIRLTALAMNPKGLHDPVGGFPHFVVAQQVDVEHEYINITKGILNQSDFKLVQT